jgi:hypothetical protein
LTGHPKDNKARICFKRIKASELLDKNDKDFSIQNYLLEEDKALDKLDDEQFPGMLYARMKIYTEDPPEKDEVLFKDSVF